MLPPAYLWFGPRKATVVDSGRGAKVSSLRAVQMVEFDTAAGHDYTITVADT